MSCPQGYLFDTSKKMCNFAEKVKCSNSSTTGCDPSIDFAPLPNDCQRFFRCLENKVLILSCPNGYQFNQKLKICERNNGTCIKGTTNPMMSTKPTNQSNINLKKCKKRFYEFN